MRLSRVSVVAKGDEVRIVGHLDGFPVNPYFAYPRALESFVASDADPFVPALLVPALERGEPLEIVPPVSPRLARRLRRIEDVLLSLFPAFRPAPIVVHDDRARTPGQRGVVATLFSGGVDSFYTLLKPREDEERPTHLLFMRGLEQRLDASRGADAALSAVREVAAATGTTVLSGETNLRMLFGLNYELYYHAAALVAAGLSLSRGVRRLLVPSSYSYGQLIPWGSHPILDELWSTEALEVVHDGAEARRVDKIARVVARDPVALRHLRVCLDNEAGATNCGRCRKCARTLMALELVGSRAAATGFPAVTPRALAAALRGDTPAFVEELCDLARESGRPETIALLERVSRREIRRRALRALLQSTPVVDQLLPRLDKLRRRLRSRPSAPTA